jgi:outer membrane protein assembly factor BamB
MNGDPQHSGNNTQETVLGASNVAGLQFLFQVALPAAADGAPVAVSSVVTPSGTRDLLFSTTKAGHILDLDAANGSVVWSHQYASGGTYTNSSPTIDPNRLYVYSYRLDGNVHKYQAGEPARWRRRDRRGRHRGFGHQHYRQLQRHELHDQPVTGPC